MEKSKRDLIELVKTYKVLFICSTLAIIIFSIFELWECAVISIGLAILAGFLGVYVKLELITKEVKACNIKEAEYVKHGFDLLREGQEKLKSEKREYIQQLENQVEQRFMLGEIECRRKIELEFDEKNSKSADLRKKIALCLGMKETVDGEMYKNLQNLFTLSLEELEEMQETVEAELEVKREKIFNRECREKGLSKKEQENLKINLQHLNPIQLDKRFKESIDSEEHDES